jgi:hypothetical protein
MNSWFEQPVKTIAGGMDDDEIVNAVIGDGFQRLSDHLAELP